MHELYQQDKATRQRG